MQESGASRSRALKLKLPQNCNRNTKIWRLHWVLQEPSDFCAQPLPGSFKHPRASNRIREQHYFGAGGRNAGKRQWNASGQHTSGWQLLCWPKADAAVWKSLSYLPVKGEKRKPQQSLLVLCQELAEPINLFPPHTRVQNATAPYVLGQPRICKGSQPARGQVPDPLTQPRGTSPACSPVMDGHQTSHRAQGTSELRAWGQRGWEADQESGAARGGKDQKRKIKYFFICSPGLHLLKGVCVFLLIRTNCFHLRKDFAQLLMTGLVRAGNSALKAWTPSSKMLQEDRIRRSRVGSCMGRCQKSPEPGYRSLHQGSAADLGAHVRAALMSPIFSPPP